MSGNPHYVDPAIADRTREALRSIGRRLRLRKRREAKEAAAAVVVVPAKRKRKPYKKCVGNYWVEGYERKCPKRKEKVGGCRMGRRGGGLLSYLKDPLNWVDPLGVRHILGFGMNSIVFFLFFSYV